MAQTYFAAMVTCAEDNRRDDAFACYEEWCVDGVDPQDGGVEILFAEDYTSV